MSQQLPESYSARGCFYARNVQRQRTPLLNHFSLLQFWQTASPSACLCLPPLPLPHRQQGRYIPGEKGTRGDGASAPGAQGPRVSTSHNRFHPLPCWFSIFLPLSPQTHGGWQMRGTVMFATETGDVNLLCLWKCRSATVAACSAGREILYHF